MSLQTAMVHYLKLSGIITANFLDWLLTVQSSKKLFENCLALFQDGVVQNFQNYEAEDTQYVTPTLQ